MLVHVSKPQVTEQKLPVICPTVRRLMGNSETKESYFSHTTAYLMVIILTHTPFNQLLLPVTILFAFPNHLLAGFLNNVAFWSLLEVVPAPRRTLNWIYKETGITG